MNNRVSLWCFIFFSFLSLKCFPQNEVRFKGENVLIGDAAYILKDSTKSYTINSVVKSSEFVESDLKTIGLELSDSDFWLRFAIRNESHANDVLLMIENPLLDHCELFFPDTNHHFKSKSISYEHDFKDREYKNQNPIFELNIPIDSTQTFYLKVSSKEQMVLPVILGKQKGISENLLNQVIMWGILIGVLLVMILYNLFLYISVRDISYLYYVLYTVFTLLTQVTLSGYTYKYLFPNSPLLFDKAVVIFPGLAGIFGIIFIRHFLHLKIKTPKLNRIFIIPLLIYACAIIFKLIDLDILSYRLIDIAAISSIIFIYIIAIIVSIQGYRPAKFFLLAWSVFFIGLILFILRNSGIIPYNFFTNYTMQIGIIVEVTLLSLALADRINILKKEKEASQAEALLVLKENERIILQQNVVLEQKVKKRTLELVTTNDELNDTLENLKQTQSQLVESEKMASLGQLTAGIAHEINNPINFVTSNVAPLKRDLEMLFNMIEFVESVSLTEKTTSEKQSEIDDYKEELEYDYLKTEINHLLGGIYDGASRTAEIVKGLRIFSRVDEDDLKMADINEGLSSTLIIMNSQLNGNGIRLVEDFGELPPVECYPGKLNQVFLNIISNAIDAIKVKEEEHFKGEIKLKTTIENEMALISITDNGTGLDEKTKQKIFDPFFTTKNVGEGTGLGMSIVYNTIKKHQGEIIINTELGKGTEFIIKIPLKPHQVVNI